MVTKEEFGQLIAEFESFRDLALEEFGKIETEIEKLRETVNDVIRETKVNVTKRIN